MRMMLTIERMACESSKSPAPRAVRAPLGVQVSRKPATATV
jgi:hypothetical protein